MVRLFAVAPEGAFSELVEREFQVEHEEAVLEAWLEGNPGAILEDGKLLILGRQVRTNLSTLVDLLGIDRQGNVVVVELKRDRTPRDTLAQAIEYASFVESLNADQLEDILRAYTGDEGASLALYHREYFELAADEPVVFNQEQRLVIVGQRVTPEIRQASAFLRRKGIRVTCLEFTFFQAESGLQLLSSDIVVGREPTSPAAMSAGSPRKTTPERFVASLDDHGRDLFLRLLEFAKERSCPIHWGTKGFSLNVDLEGTHVSLCDGYPPGSVFGQSIYTTLVGRGGLLTKVAVSEQTATALAQKARASGLFQPAGRELKCMIERRFADDEVAFLLSWLDEFIAVVRSHGLKGREENGE